MRDGQWRLPLAVAAAGVGCGFFWEFWNFWASPKWTYSIPFVHFVQVFEEKNFVFEGGLKGSANGGAQQREVPADELAGGDAAMENGNGFFVVALANAARG